MSGDNPFKYTDNLSDWIAVLLLNPTLTRMPHSTQVKKQGQLIAMVTYNDDSTVKEIAINLELVKSLSVA